MQRRLLSLPLTIVVLLAGIAPVGAELSSARQAHACCRTVQAPPAGHEGCSQTAAARMRCCAPAPDRSSETQAQPAGATTSHQPDFTLLRGHTAHVPGLPGLVNASVAHAFESARLKLPHDPLYLRNLVLLV